MLKGRIRRNLACMGGLEPRVVLDYDPYPEAGWYLSLRVTGASTREVYEQTIWSGRHDRDHAGREAARVQLQRLATLFALGVADVERERTQKPEPGHGYEH